MESENSRKVPKTITAWMKHQKLLAKDLYDVILRARRRQLKNAKRSIDELAGLSEDEKKLLFEAFRLDYEKYRMSFNEWYYSYDFPHLSEKQKKEYLSERDYIAVWRKYRLIYPKQSIITNYKQMFLEEYKPFVQRRWLYADENTSEEELQALLDNMDVIAKPTNACSGKGVYKIRKGEGKARNVLSGSLPMLVEECIHNVDELAAFHTASLNTVRITTMTNGRDIRVLGACLRTGNNGSVFDNADAGGYFAEIDEKTGEIISDGITEWGVQAAAHPASGKVFRGTVIPRWDEVMDVVYRATAHLENTYLIAWDIAVTPQGIEIIEGNSIPSMEVHQMPLHRGIRRKFFSIMDELGMPYKDVVFYTKLFSWVFSWKR